MMRRFEDTDLSLFEGATLIVCSGFEERVCRSLELIVESNIRMSGAFLATYPDSKNLANERSFRDALPRAISGGGRIVDARIDDATTYSQQLADFVHGSSHVVCDITGFNTAGLFWTLETIANSGVDFSILYTEAGDYHPTKAEFEEFVPNGEHERDIESLRNYELSENVYSNDCELSIVDGFEGHFSSGYPYFLIAFLPFKRSRLGVLLEEVSASERLLIIGVPERSELKWRAEMLEKINYDLVHDGVSKIHRLSTLDFDECLKFLNAVYNDKIEQVKYRYNFMLAPLGSKIQKLSCWAFGRQNPNICIITSSPKSLYDKNYSIGHKDTFVITRLNQRIEELRFSAE